MIEQLYLDLAEETNDQKFYGKLFITCQAAAEELLGENGVVILDLFSGSSTTPFQCSMRLVAEIHHY